MHSAYDWSGSPVFMTPKDHDLHHHFGLENSNFAAIFTPSLQSSATDPSA